jgi:hypothetical protein
MVKINSDDYHVSQNFPLLCSNFVGKDIISEPKTILDLFCNYLNH